LPPVGRTASGIRRYTERDLSRLRFIQRARKMNFTLAEIADLLKIRANPQRAREGVRTITAAKLDAVEDRLREITALRNELRRLLSLCRASADGCPIIDKIDSRPRTRNTAGRKPTGR
jgi:DNA-binding transcriptional MerR regulator